VTMKNAIFWDMSPVRNSQETPTLHYRAKPVNTVWGNSRCFCKNRAEHTDTIPVVLYGCETWCLTVREEHKLRVFENRVLSIFGAKRVRVSGGWRKLHNEELHKL
jgi:hypothetical protein